MSYKNRSKEYDWFKGGNNQKGKSPKTSLKTTWKFTKIFLMFSLFFFSMWGCVQVFTIKTDNHVGSGVEFYNSEAEIAPHVTEFELTKDTKGIYELKPDQRNVWLNKHENDSELKAVQAVLKSDGTEANAHKMSDSVKGINEYTRLVNEDKKPLITTGYLTMSSEQKEYMGLKMAAPKTITFYEIEKNTNGVDVLKKTPVVFNILNKATKSIDQARAKFQEAILGAVDASLQQDYLKANPTNQPTLEEAKAHNNTWTNLLAYLDVKRVVNKDKTQHDAELYGMHLVGTKYRPIISWNHAWTRGVGPFYGLFVWPIAKMGVAITNGLGMHEGWESLFALVMIVFILRIVGFGLTFKSTLQQTKQQEVQAKKAIIDAKYASYQGNKQMEARKKQEIAELYKKEGISPLGALGSMFITMPIFLSIWRVIGGVPHLKSTVWLGINFSATSYKELLAGEWQYLPLMILAAAAAAFQQIYPRLLTKKRDKTRVNVHQKAAMKKNNKTQNIVLVVFVVMSLIFSAGIQVYWIVGGIWQIIQTTATHHILINERKKRKNRVKV